jgi:hypothetical protein
MEHQDSEPDVGIIGGYSCDGCSEFIPDWDIDDESDLALAC